MPGDAERGNYGGVMIIFCEYSSNALTYLEICGNDVSRIEQMEGEPTFICSHYRANGGWEKGLSATFNRMPGEYLDEKAILGNRICTVYMDCFICPPQNPFCRKINQ